MQCSDVSQLLSSEREEDEDDGSQTVASLPLPPEYSQIYSKFSRNSDVDPLRDFHHFLHSTGLEDDFVRPLTTNRSRRHGGSSSKQSERPGKPCPRFDLTQEHLAHLQTLVPAFKLPPQPVLERYLRASYDTISTRFLFCFHSDSTAQGRAIHLCLLSIGAQALHEDVTATSLYNAGRIVTFDILHSHEHKHNETGPFDNHEPETYFEVLRALLLINEFMHLQEGGNFSRDAFLIRAHTVYCLTRLSSAYMAPDFRTRIQSARHKEYRETITLAFCKLNLQAVLFGTDLGIVVPPKQVHLTGDTTPNPQSRPSSAQDSRFEGALPPTLDHIMLSCLDDTASPPIECWLHNRNNIYILATWILYCLELAKYSQQAMVLQCQDGRTDFGFLTSFGIAIERCDDAWHNLQEHSDEDEISSIFANHHIQSLLSMARLRLISDIDCRIILQSASQIESAKQLHRLPRPKRSPQLLPVLEHCARILEQPSKIGIMLYARIWLSTWPLERVMAALQHIIFLSKWLQELSFSLHKEPLTSCEEELYKKILTQSQLVDLGADSAIAGPATTVSAASLSIAIVRALELMFSGLTNKSWFDSYSKILESYGGLLKGRTYRY